MMVRIIVNVKFRDSEWSGTEVEIDGEELMIMKESDVMGLIDSGAAAGNKR